MTDIDFETRELCPDDTCIGVLDAKGVCPECGKSAPRQTPFRSLPNPQPEPEPDSDPASGSAPSDFDPNARELCPDDVCIGLIGPDGRCKECGRPRQS